MIDPQDRPRAIEFRLIQAFQPTHLVVTDDSEAHRGHPGAQAGGGHFSITIVAAAFADQSMIQQHRLVYKALADLMTADIHALRIDAKPPE
jgi:stress-induced morphogen